MSEPAKSALAIPFAEVETKSQPSKWLTLRALQVLAHFSDGPA